MKDKKLNLVEISCPLDNCTYRANNRNELFSHLEYNCAHFRNSKLDYSDLKAHYNQSILKEKSFWKHKIGGFN